jgi:hypothetical protein
MARVSLWLQLLLVVLMLRQSAVASDRSNKQKGETDCLEEALKTTRAQNHDCETWAGSGQVSVYIKPCVLCKLVLLLSNAHVPLS